MNCERCPHMKRIREALMPCQNCDAGKLHGQVSVDRSKTPDAVYSHRAMTIHEQQDGVTNLPPDIEDRLRKFMCAIFQLPPEMLLLVQNCVLGRNYSDLRHTLARLNRNLRSKEHELNSESSQGFRQLANIWAKRVIQKVPQLELMMRARIDGQ